MTDKKRPGDRDVYVEKHATPATGVPAVPQAVPLGEFADQDFTPVGKVIERIEEVMPISERDRMLLRLFWQHTANMEMRSRKRRRT